MIIAITGRLVSVGEREATLEVGQLHYELLIPSFDREALAARDTETSQSGGTSVCSYTTEPIARFADSASGDSYNLVLVQTDSGLSMHFEDRCDSPIASLDLP